MMRRGMCVHPVPRITAHFVDSYLFLVLHECAQGKRTEGNGHEEGRGCICMEWQERGIVPTTQTTIAFGVARSTRERAVAKADVPQLFGLCIAQSGVAVVHP